MPKYDGIPINFAPELPDPGYEYDPETGFTVRPDKLQELTKKINVVHVPGDVPATEKQIQELIRSPLSEEPN